MNKYSVAAIAAAIILGLILGSYFQSNKAEKELAKQRATYEKKLERKGDSLLDVIHHRDKELFDLDKQVKGDSIKIRGLLHKIQQDGIKTELKRAEAKKFTPSERVEWLKKRYGIIQVQ